LGLLGLPRRIQHPIASTNAASWGQVVNRKGASTVIADREPRSAGLALSDATEWNEHWASATVGYSDHILFESVFRSHLSADPTRSVLEVGCVPGRFLAWVSRAFGYPAYGKDLVEFFVNPWLQDRGYLSRNKGTGELASGKKSLLYRVGRWGARRLLPPVTRNWLRTSLKGEDHDPHELIDWESSSAFCAVNGFTAARNGFLHTVEQRGGDQLADEIAAELSEIEEQNEGRAVFEMVVPCSVLYGGAWRSRLRFSPSIQPIRL
jgi:hypothetical protein